MTICRIKIVFKSLSEWLKTGLPEDPVTWPLDIMFRWYSKFDHNTHLRFLHFEFWHESNVLKFLKIMEKPFLKSVRRFAYFDEQKLRTLFWRLQKMVFFGFFFFELTSFDCQTTKVCIPKLSLTLLKLWESLDYSIAWCCSDGTKSIVREKETIEL